jgi:hypothetical protein
MGLLFRFSGQCIAAAASSMKAVAGRGVMPASRSGWSSQVPGWVSEYNAIPIREAISGLIRALLGVSLRQIHRLKKR